MRMKSLIFDNWHQWKVCFLSGCKKALWGICRIITCIIFGIVSILVWIGKQIEAFCKRETVAAMIVAVVFISLSFGWLSTFMSSRMELKAAMCQRDSVSVKLSRYMQAYDSTSTIIVDNDTIRR